MRLYIKRLVISTLLFGVLSEVALADECGELINAQAVLDCALKRHPQGIRARISAEQGATLEAVARQIPNPELSGKGVYGDNFGTRVGTTEISLTHNFEIGGKRGARIDKAISEKEEILSRSQMSLEEVYIDTAKTLYHIKHMNAELSILDEALHTFSKIHRQYQSRPRLNPEQQVTNSIFQLAEGDYRLRRALLEAEINDLERHLKIAVGGSLKVTDKILPPRKSKWPELNASSTDLSNGSEWRLSFAELKKAQAELNLAQSSSWPDLRIGPTIEIESEGGASFQTYGLSLSMDFPLFNINGPGRTYAAQGLAIAENTHDAKKRSISEERKALVVRYQKSLKALAEAVSHKELERKHKNIESLFQRGIIASSLVIEAHRQLVDFTKSQNEQELDALETYWKVKAMDGKLLEEKL